MPKKKNKKTNPHRVRVSAGAGDVQQILAEESENTVFRAWVLVLSALADCRETTAEDMVSLWHAVNDFSRQVGESQNIDAEMAEVDCVLHRTMPWDRIPAKDLQTVGAVKRFRKRVHQKAMYSAFVLIAYPLIRQKVLPPERIREIIDQAYRLDEELFERHLSVEDLQMVLVDEFGLLLSCENGRTTLSRLCVSKDS